MLIEHDGKTIDTEREMQTIVSKYPVRYAGTLSNGNHIFEWGDTAKAWDWHTNERVVQNFENVPQKHERWVNIYSERDGYNSKAEADAAASPNRIACCKLEWQS